MTAAVHYLRFELTAEQVTAFDGPVVLLLDHPAYHEEVELLPATVAELLTDLRD